MKVYKLKINYHNARKSYTKGTKWLKIENRNYYRPEDEPKGHDLHMDFVEKNPDIFEDCTKEWLIEEAIRRYPIGTKYRSKVSGYIREVKSSNFIHMHTATNNIPGILSNSDGWVYLDGKWAEIVKDDPLFTTEDGVEVFEDTHVWWYNKNWELWDTKSPDKNLVSRVTFSTKEKAQEYIDLHKPQYSKQDFIDAIVNSYPKSSYDAVGFSRQKKILDELDKNA